MLHPLAQNMTPGWIASSGVTEGIHAGKNGDAESLITQKKVTAVGWEQMSDLPSLLIKPRADFEKRYGKVLLVSG